MCLLASAQDREVFQAVLPATPIPTPREVRKTQLKPRDLHLPELSAEEGESPGMADKEVNDVLRSLGIRHHDVKNAALFREGVTEIRFVLNVKVGFGKTLTFITRTD